MALAKTTTTTILAAVMACTTGTAALSQSFATGDVNFRTGPGVGFSRIATIPRGAPVAVNGCVPAGWCNVTYGYTDGWVSARYLGQAPMPAVHPVNVMPVRTVHARPVVPHHGYVQASQPIYVQPAQPVYVQVQPVVRQPQVYYQMVPAVSYSHFVPMPVQRIQMQPVMPPAYGTYMVAPQPFGGWSGTPVVMYR